MQRLRVKQILIAILLLASSLTVLPLTPVFAGPGVTQKANNVCGASSTTCISNSFTASTVGEVIIISVGTGPANSNQGSYSGTTISTTLSSITFTKQTSFTNCYALCGGTGNYIDAEVWTGTIGAMSTGTVTFTFNQLSGNAAISVIEVSGISATATCTATGGSGTGSGTSATTTTSCTNDTSHLAVGSTYTASCLTTTGGASYTTYPNTGSRCGDMIYGSFAGSTNYPYTISAGGSPWIDDGALFGPGTSTINLTCIVKESGAPSETVTLTGGSPSPSTATCSTGAGTTTAITVTPACTLTVTVATDGANTRYRFNASATTPTTQNITCPSGGGSSSVTIWNYYQLQNTYKMTPSSPATWDSGYTEPVIGTVTGVGSTTGCSVTLTNGGGAASCQTWFDYNLVVTEVASFASAVAGNWVSQAPNTFTQTTGGNTNNVNYILQFGSTFTIICVNPTTCDNAMTLAITGTVGGSPATICTITTSSASNSASCTGNADTGTTATFAHFLTGAPAQTRYENQAGASSTVLINNPFTFTVNYFLEDNQTVRYQIFCILGAVCGVPNIIYSVLGSQVGPTPMSMSDQAIWMDFGSSALASSSVTDNKGNTYTTSTTSWKITAPNVITHPIVYSTTTVATSTTTIIAWNAPDGKHYANGLGAMFFILLGAGGFACLPIVFRRRGDFVITMMLVGALLGLVVATLPNGQAASANSLIAPIGAIVMGGALLVLWIVKGARGGPAQQ